MRLRPNLRVLGRGPAALQFGADPRWATLLAGLSTTERDLLLVLGSDDRPSSDTLVARSAAHAVPEDRLLALVSVLAEAGLLSPAPPATGRVPSAQLDDAAAIEASVPGAHGAATLARRHDAVVALCGAGRLGMVVAGTLAGAGVGTLLLEDERPVRTADVGVGGFREKDVGAPRSRAGSEVVSRAHPAARVRAGVSAAPDVVVLVFEEVADSMRTARLMSEGVPHLAVTVREGDVVVGPFVEPGRSPCLTCLDLHRTDQDSGWADVAPQLRRAGRLTPPAVDSSLAALAGAMAAAQVLARLDGFRSATTGASIEVSLPDALPRLRRWEMHPGCGCIDVAPA